MAAEKWHAAKEQTAAPSSLLRYDMAFRKHLLPRFGDIQLRKLRTMHLDEYYASLRERGMAPNSILSQHNLIHVILRDAQRSLKWIADNPADEAHRPGGRQRRSACRPRRSSPS
jgi:hypothetical protein